MITGQTATPHFCHWGTRENAAGTIGDEALPVAIN
jgi:hypothetical protein